MNTLVKFETRDVVREDIEELNNYIIVANTATQQSTFAQISHSQKHLDIAKGLFGSLYRRRALANWKDVEEEINRIERKLADIRGEKNRNYRPEKRRP